MSTAARRRSVLAITCLSLGLTLGCSASETTNTSLPHTGTGGAPSTAGSNATGGSASVGGRTNGGAPGAGGSTNAGGQTSTGTNPCNQGLACSGIGQCSNPPSPYRSCQCNGGKYSCV